MPVNPRSQAPMNTGMGGNTVIVMPQFGSDPLQLVCPKCGAQVIDRVQLSLILLLQRPPKSNRSITFLMIFNIH